MQLIRLFKIRAINFDSFHAGKPAAYSKASMLLASSGRNTDTPFIILHQINDRKFFQNSNLEGFTHFPFGNTGIAERTNTTERLLISPGFVFSRKANPCAIPVAGIACIPVALLW